MARPALRLSQALRIRRSLQTHSRPHTSSRFASTNPGGSAEAAQKKAQDVMATVQKYAAEAFAAGKKFLGPAGDKLGNMLGSYRQPLLYNLSVTREVFKQVYLAERLQPPTSLSTFTHVYSILWARARDPAYWRQLAQSGEWAKVGVYAVEAYTIFKIGEIIGRRHLVGYNIQ